MNITLVYPPISTSISCPPNSLGALKAYLQLRTNAFVEIRDLNIEFFHYLLDRWEDLLPLVEDRLKTTMAVATALTNVHERFLRLIHFHLPLVSHLADQKIRCHASELLLRLLREIIDAYYTFDILHEGYFLRCDYSTLSFAMNRNLSDPIMEGFVDSLEIKKTRLLGFSLIAESQLPFSVLLVRLLKDRLAGVYTVAGGPYITEIIPQLPLGIFEDFDFLVGQEGESALSSIIESLESRWPVQHPNVFTKVASSPRNFLTEPIEFLPPPDFSGLDLTKYFILDPFLPVFSSKGCSWGKCLFCSQNSLSYREMSVNKFVSVLEQVLKQTGLAHFQFIDENIKPLRLKEISEEIIKNGLNLRWFIQVRFEKTLTKQILRIMKEAGCHTIEFGLESGSEEMLRMIRKGIVLSSVERILHDCADLELDVILNCMVGFPGEAPGHVEQTVTFLDALVDKIPKLRFSCNTQSVKIYRASRYAASADVISTAHPLSTVTEWQRPVWLDEFRYRLRHHFIFTGQTVYPRIVTDECDIKATESDPTVILQPNCHLLEGIQYDFSKQIQTTEAHSYLVVVQPETLLPNIFLINETMVSIVAELKNGSMRLSNLRRKFKSVYENFDKADVGSAFKDGLLRLNEIGGLLIC